MNYDITLATEICDDNMIYIYTTFQELDYNIQFKWY